MRALAVVSLLVAIVGIVVWMVRMGVEDYRELRRSDDPAAPQIRLGRVRGVVALVALPVLVFIVLGLPNWVSSIYLVGVVVVLGPIVVRRRLASRRRR